MHYSFAKFQEMLPNALGATRKITITEDNFCAVPAFILGNRKVACRDSQADGKKFEILEWEWQGHRYEAYNSNHFPVRKFPFFKSERDFAAILELCCYVAASSQKTHSKNNFTHLKFSS